MKWEFVVGDVRKVSGPCLFIGKRTNGELIYGFANIKDDDTISYLYLDQFSLQPDDLESILYTYRLSEPFKQANEIIEHEILRKELENPNYLNLKAKEMASDLASFIKKHKIILSEI